MKWHPVLIKKKDGSKIFYEVLSAGEAAAEKQIYALWEGVKEVTFLKRLPARKFVFDRPWRPYRVEGEVVDAEGSRIVTGVYATPEGEAKRFYSRVTYVENVGDYCFTIGDLVFYFEEVEWQEAPKNQNKEVGR